MPEPPVGLLFPPQPPLPPPGAAARLAARHGLVPSGARPTLVRYTAELWARRHFVTAFAAARLDATYTTARLGRLWQVITPLVNAAVYFAVFGLLLGTRHGIDNFPAYLCTGVFLFHFTQQAVQAGTRSIADNLGLIRAVRFPRACLPLAVTVAQLRQLALSLGVLAGVVLLTGEPLTGRWLQVIPALGLQTLFTVGLAMIVARLAARTTDLVQLMPFMMRAWMYASGVFYHPGAFTGHVPPVLAGVLQANPMLVYLDLTRNALMSSAPPHPAGGWLWLVGLGWAVLTGVGGYVFCWQAEQEYGRG
ncbi:MAG TPA: ABC transporter permease [Catenuloplanes sp.]|jgi:teichoic acid transport system permease protein